MGWQVVFSTRSMQDLQRIVEHIAAGRFHRSGAIWLALIDRAESIANMPEMGVLIPERPGTRFLPHGSYL